MRRRHQNAWHDLPIALRRALVADFDDRRLEVAILLFGGVSQNRIALHLGISRGGVRYHIDCIRCAVDKHTRALYPYVEESLNG